jgi:hypothetical protein
MTTARAIALLTALLVILAAAPGLAKAPAACELITPAEAGQASGLKLKPGKLTGPNPLGQTICFFDSENDSALHYVQITITDPPPKMRAHMSADKLYKRIVADMGGAAPVPGIGDEAVWGGSGRKKGAGLHVLLGDYYILVDVATGDSQRNLEAAKKLAMLIAKRVD